MSCGVDSMYTFQQYHKGKYRDLNLTHFFICPSSIDLKILECENLHEWKNKYRLYMSRIANVSSKAAIPIVYMFSNFMHFLCDKKRIRHLYVGHYLTMANVLSLKKFWYTYFYSSAYPFITFNLTNNSCMSGETYELLLLHVLSTPGFFCFSGGVSKSRIEKTLALRNNPFAKEFLHPCFTHEIKNCSRPTCNKCLRALFTFDAYDCLDEFSDRFDIDLYKRNKIDYFVALTRLKNDKFLKDLYNILSGKYPELMRKAAVKYTFNKYTALVKEHKSKLVKQIKKFKSKLVKKCKSLLKKVL